MRTAAILLPFVLLAAGSAAMAATPASKEPVEQIVVVGTQTDPAAARREAAVTPGGIDVIDMDAFRHRDVSSLADVLRYVPGVWAASDSGTDAMFFSSRGSNLDATDYDMNGIKLLKDGLPITTADGSNHNRIVDPLSARHVVVARGANAVRYGASTLGGAMNFVSVTARNGPPLALSLGAGRFGERLGRLTVSDVFNDRFDGLLTIERKAWDGYRDHNGQRRLGLYGNAGWQMTDALATRFYGTWIENDQELPGSLSRAQVETDRDRANAAAAGGDYQLDVDTWRLAAKTSWTIDERRRLEVGLSVEEQTLFHPIVDRVMVDFDGAGPAPPTEVFSLLIDTDQRNVGAVVRYRQRLGAHDVLLGFNYGTTSVDGGNYRNLGGRRNGLTTRIDNEATLLEAFALDRWTLTDRLSLILALQSVRATRDVRNRDVRSGALHDPGGVWASVNPRIGLLYDLGDDTRVYANVSRLYEPPTHFELEDQLAGGDATLAAMSGIVAEIGARGRARLGAASRWSWDVSLYRAVIDNEILSVRDPAAPGTSLATNIDETVHAGIEAVARASLALGAFGSRRVEPVVALSINRFRFVDDIRYGDNTLPAAPDLVVRGEVMLRAGNGFYFGPTVATVGDRYADFANTYEVDGYTVVGFRAGFSARAWSVYVDITNLLDEDYIATHSVRSIAAPNDAILNPGTPLAAYVGVRWQP